MRISYSTSSYFLHSALFCFHVLMSCCSSLLNETETLFMSWEIPYHGEVVPNFLVPPSGDITCHDRLLNPFLSSGAWSATHYNSYSQSSTSTSFLYGATSSFAKRYHRRVEETESVGGGAVNTTKQHTKTRVISNENSPLYLRTRRIAQAVANLTLQPLGKRAQIEFPRHTNTVKSNDSMISSLKILPSEPEAVSSNTESLYLTYRSTATATYDFLFAPAIASDPISLLYTNDNKYVWGSSFTTTFKMDRSYPMLRIVDAIRRKGIKNRRRTSDSQPTEDLFHGAYSLLSNENAFYSLSGAQLEMYGDDPILGSEHIKKLYSIELNQASQSQEANSTKSTSSIGRNISMNEILRNFFRIFLSNQRQTMPSEAVVQSKGNFVGRALCMLFDGTIAIVTRNGYLATVKASKMNGFTELTPLFNISPDSVGVQVSNSMACDEDGGIYIVSHRFMHKMRWNGSCLSAIWHTPYSSSSSNSLSVNRLGEGSGSTPSLMGQLKSSSGLYVAITDDSTIMNLVVFDAFTGELLDRAEVNFGHPDIRESLSEQSVLVMGNRLAVVNNTPRSAKLKAASQTLVKEGPTFLKGVANYIPTALGDSPQGIQQFEFDYNMKKLKTTWFTDISIPNGIPSASCKDGIMYGIGRRKIKEFPDEIQRAASAISNKTGWVLDGPGALHGVWTLEGIDWMTGKSVIQEIIGWNPALNSLYAATEIGPGELITGTLGGVLRIRTWKRE